MKHSDCIHDCLTENLSGVRLSTQAQNQLLDTITGGMKMKKKASVGMAILLCALLLSACALAAALLWQETAETVAPLEGANGYYDTWSTDEKVQLVRILHDAGELPDSPQLTALLGEQTADTDALCDQIMTDYVNGTADTVTLESILQQLHGDISTWTDEEKVWYEDLLKRNGLLGDASGYALPDTGEISREDALQIASRFFADLGLTDLDATQVEATFSEQDMDYWYGETQVSRKGHRGWSIVYRATPNMHIDIGADGTVEGYGLPLLADAYLYGTLPPSDALPKEQAIEKAAQALGDAVDTQSLQAYYAYYTLKEEEGTLPVLGQQLWLVQSQDGRTVLLSKDGSLLSCQ